MELINAFDVLADRLKNNGLLVIVDVEKFYESANSDPEALLDGRKEEGSGSREVIAALNEIGMEDIAVIEDQDFKVEVDLCGRRMATHQKYFMLKARKGEEEKDQNGEDLAPVGSIGMTFIVMSERDDESCSLRGTFSFEPPLATMYTLSADY